MRRQSQLGCEKRLEVVPGATHLFEEPGTLDAVAELARDWFCQPPRSCCQAKCGTMRLALAGDTMLGRQVAERLVEEPKARLFSDGVVETVKESDLFVLNLECAISERGEPWPAPRKPFFFRAPPAAAEASGGPRCRLRDACQQPCPRLRPGCPFRHVPSPRRSGHRLGRCRRRRARCEDADGPRVPRSPTGDRRGRRPSE